MIEGLLVAAALLVAFSNGANDNFKGFATVWGSDTLSYRQALLLATVATVVGSVLSLSLAEALVQNFSGKGLVPDAVANAPTFMLAVASGTALTVLLATRLGLPVSTTHALIGGLIGAGLSQTDSVIHWASLTNTFLAPLLFAPLLTALLSALLYRSSVRYSKKATANTNTGATSDCACLVIPTAETQVSVSEAALMQHMHLPHLVVDSAAACTPIDAPIKISLSRNLDRLHVLSAMSICFARGVNDTPKMVALLLATQVLHTQLAVIVIAVAMAVGGLLFARQVARTLSRRVTHIKALNGLAANLVTAGMVLFASQLGLPVSTTHVAVGAITGVGASTQSLNRQAVRHILLSWLATLPLAAAVAWSVNQMLL